MKTEKIIYLKLLVIFPAFLIFILTLGSCASRKMQAKVNDDNTLSKASATQEEPFVVVEQMPMFPGGDTALLTYIAQNTKYPESAKINNITGQVIIRFCVESTGIVARISVLKGVSPDIDAEALRVIGTLPAFQPGKQGGKPVPVWFMLPVTFMLGKSPSESLTPLPPSSPPPPTIK